MELKIKDENITNKPKKAKFKNQNQKKLKNFYFFFVKLDYLSLFKSQKKFHGSNQFLVEK